MQAFIKRNLFLIIVFFVTLLLGFITFLTFIEKNFFNISDESLKYLLIVDIILLLIFFGFIFLETKNSLKQNINVRGSLANRKYIIFFSLFTLIPSILISIFSLFLFSFAIEKYFDKKITTAVNNSYEIARRYVSEKRNKIESDVIIVAYDINRNLNYIKNKDNFQTFINNQRIIRGLDQIHIIDKDKNVLMSSSETGYIPIEDEALRLVLNEERPLKIINAFENYSGAIIKLPQYKNLFLYVVRYLDEDISKLCRLDSIITFIDAKFTSQHLDEEKPEGSGTAHGKRPSDRQGRACADKQSLLWSLQALAQSIGAIRIGESDRLIGGRRDLGRGVELHLESIGEHVELQRPDGREHWVGVAGQRVAQNLNDALAV